MTNENPFDKTPFGPPNPSQGNEDPFHGRDSVESLLAIPPYKNEDGTFHVFGGYYVCGTNSFDAEGRPFIKFKSSHVDSNFLRETTEHNKWIDAFNEGELPPREEMELPEFQFEERPYFVIDKQDGQNTQTTRPSLFDYESGEPKPVFLGHEILELMREPDWRSDITVHIDTDSLAFHTGASDNPAETDQRFVIAGEVSPSDVVDMVRDALPPPEDKVQASRRFYKDILDVDATTGEISAGPDLLNKYAESFGDKKAETPDDFGVISRTMLAIASSNSEQHTGMWAPEVILAVGKELGYEHAAIAAVFLELVDQEVIQYDPNNDANGNGIILTELGRRLIEHDDEILRGFSAPPPPMKRYPETIATSFDKPYFKDDSDKAQHQGIIEQLDEATDVPNLDDVLGIDPPIIEE